MIKKCLFLFCVLCVVQTKSDCADNFLKCFSDFAESFFHNITEIEHVNASTENIPEDYKQVKDVEIKTLEDITDSIQDEFFKHLNSRVASDVVAVTDNPKTKIFVKTFSYSFGDSFLSGLENFKFNSDEYETEEEAEKVEQVKKVDQTEKVNQTKNLEGNEKYETEQFTIEDRSTTTEQITDIINKENKNHETIITNEGSASIPAKSVNIDMKNNTQEQNMTEITASALTTMTPNHNIQQLTEKEPKKDILAKILQINNSNDNISTTNNTNNTNQEQKQLEDKSLMQTVNPNHNTQKLSEKEPKKDKPTKILQINNSDDNMSTTNNTNNTDQEQKQLEDKSLARTVNPNHNKQKNLAEIQFEKDIRENLIQTDDEKYDYNIEETSDYPQIDYIDLYKDTTNEENEYVPTVSPTPIDMNDEIVENVEEYSLEIETDPDIDNSTNICHGNNSDVSNIFPWIATIFIKNDTTNNQFQYICDGALLNENFLITAARCVNFFNSTVNPDDILVFLGKRSLQVMGDDEKNVRISQIKIHGNFSNEDGKVDNDLALLMLEEPVTFNDGIRPACLGNGEGALGKSATTAWDLSSALKPVFFEKNKNENCDLQNGDDTTFCATYANEVALCPSYGGVYATKQSSRWYLHAIRSGDTADRGPCYTKDVLYTSLTEHLEWIMESIE